MSGRVLVLLTVVAGTAAFGTLAAAQRLARSTRVSRPALAIGVSLSVAFILVATLIPTAPEEGSRLRLDPTDGLDELQALGNVVLFVPLGGFLGLLGAPLRAAVALAAAFSIAVEVVQFLLVAGRFAATGDVILNVAGAILGHLTLTAARHRRRSTASP